MAHSKVSMLEEMKKRGGEIMAMLLLEDAHIKPDHLAIPEHCDELRADFIRPAFYWLGSIYENEYRDVVKFRKQQPDHIWARYKKWGEFEEYREVRLLKEKINVLRAKIVSRDRPDFYKKSKRATLLKAKAKEKGRVPATESA